MKRNYAFTTALATALCALGLSVSLGLAADKPKLDHQAGTIKSVDSAKHELVIQSTDKADSKPQTFTWNESTKFHHNEKAVTSAQLTPGETVHFSYQAGGAMPVLHTVKIVGSEKPAHPSANK